MFDYYTSLGVLDVRPTTLAGFQPNIPLLQNLYMYHPADRWHILLHYLLHHVICAIVLRFARRVASRRHRDAASYANLSVFC